MTKRTEKVVFVVSDGVKSRLQDISEAAGLSESEIGRRGLIHELRQLEGNND